MGFICVILKESYCDGFYMRYFLEELFACEIKIRYIKRAICRERLLFLRYGAIFHRHFQTTEIKESKQMPWPIK